MRLFNIRVLVAGVIVFAGIVLPLTAYGDSGRRPARTSTHVTTVTNRATWTLERNKIASQFRAAVRQATTALRKAKNEASSSSERFAALNAFNAAIAKAADVRSSALSQLGPQPTKSTSGDSSTTSTVPNFGGGGEGDTHGTGSNHSGGSGPGRPSDN